MPDHRETAPPQGLLAAGDRLPPLTLPSATDGHPAALRPSGRDARLLVFLRSAEGTEGHDYLRGLAAANTTLRRWDARPTAVVPAHLEAAARLVHDLRPPFPVLADVDGAARRRCGVDEGAAALFIADRWGEVYHSVLAPSESALPAPPPDGMIMQWLRYLATQCPECGVPDEPGQGEWAW